MYRRIVRHHIVDRLRLRILDELRRVARDGERRIEEIALAERAEVELARDLTARVVVLIRQLRERLAPRRDDDRAEIVRVHVVIKTIDFRTRAIRAFHPPIFRVCVRGKRGGCMQNRSRKERQ